MTEIELKQLNKLCEKLDAIAKQENIRLRIVETKGTIYFFPEFEN